MWIPVQHADIQFVRESSKKIPFLFLKGVRRYLIWSGYFGTLLNTTIYVGGIGVRTVRADIGVGSLLMTTVDGEETCLIAQLVR